MFPVFLKPEALQEVRLLSWSFLKCEKIKLWFSWRLCALLLFLFIVVCAD